MKVIDKLPPVKLKYDEEITIIKSGKYIAELSKNEAENIRHAIDRREGLTLFRRKADDGSYFVGLRKKDSSAT